MQYPVSRPEAAFLFLFLFFYGGFLCRVQKGCRKLVTLAPLATFKHLSDLIITVLLILLRTPYFCLLLNFLAVGNSSDQYILTRDEF